MSSDILRVLFFRDIEVLCSIGLHDHERGRKQRVLIDLEIHLSATDEPTADKVDETLDYDLVFGVVMDIVTAGHYDLQETLARRIFDEVRVMRDVIGLVVMTQKPEAYENCRSVAYRLSDIG